ncbi:MAG: rod shape-determining protein MreC [Candidatus Paceibacterota bacterium]|jgi:cell shape-determining protein MreC
MSIKHIGGWGIFIGACLLCAGLLGMIPLRAFSWHPFGSMGNSAANDEVMVLRGRIAALEQQLASAQTQSPPVPTSSITAKVFSVYPFNAKSRIFIAAGSNDGIVVGDAVVADGNVFIGRVVAVYAHASEVMTIFDQDFLLSVRVGSGEVDGSLQGGVTPRVVYAYTEKSPGIGSGDAVVSVDKAYPYGLLVGTTRSFQEDRSGSFFDSDVATPYAIKDLRTVFVFPLQTHL